MIFKNGQGTIEYLVIMAVIVVIGLLVVGMASTFLSSSSGISSGIGGLNSLTGPISVSDTVADSEGDGYSAFTNNSGETLTITKVTLGGVDNNYNQQVIPGNELVFKFDDLLSGCTCSTPGETRTCSMTVYYTSVNGVPNSVTKSVTVDCVGDASTDQDAVNPAEDVAPVVSLSSAVGVGSVFTFSYSVDDNSDVSSCDLVLNGVVDQTDLSTPFSSFTKGFMSPQVTSWDVNCTDEHGNEGTGVVGNISDDGPYYLSNCLDLNAMSYRLDANYILLSNIDCYAATHSGGDLWNGGSGFDSIGRDSPYFEGAVDGNYNTISNLFIDRTTSYNGLIGVSAGTITNLSLTDFNINSTGNSIGGLVGYNADSGTINNVRVDGNVMGAISVGLLVGTNDGMINNTYSEGFTTCSRQKCGGLVGQNYDFVYNSYSTATVASQSYIGVSSAGGLVGFSQPDEVRSLIINSFASGAVTGTGAYNGGLVGMAVSTDINNSFYYNFAGNPGACVAYTSSSTVDCNSDMDLAYFKDDIYPNNQPFTEWDFSTVWEEVTGEYPELAFED
jgi:hypothetical protein